MKRRDFLKKATLTAAGTVSMPYILPTGRLFASTGSQMAGHVVFVMFAGGVRQQEAVGKKYLAESQGLDIEGNIMYNMLTGDVPGLDTIDHKQVVVGTVGDEFGATVHELRSHVFGVDNDLPRIVFELGLKRFFEGDGFGRHHLHNRSALKTREHRLVDLLTEFGFTG